jgi:dTDP-4-amino-4,6-dideoxygalactose transaminase
MMSRSTRPFIPFAKPSIGSEEIAAAVRVLESGWLTTAKESAALEEEFAAAVAPASPASAPARALAVNSATAGLHLALEASGIRPGQRVLMSPYTFTSTGEVVRYLGAHPLFVDIDYGTLAMDEEQALEKIERNPEIAAVMPVHIAGLRTTTESFVGELRSRGIRVIEDAAHLCPSLELPAARALGDFVVYSFYATKPMTTGEGGMVVTYDAPGADRIAIMRLHGIDRPVWDRQKGAAKAWEYDVVAPGYKYNLPDLSAALGRIQLRRSPELRRRRQEIARNYLSALGDRDYLALPEYREEHSWHLFIVSLREGRISLARDELAQELADRGIGTSVHYKPLHLMSYYRESYGFEPDDFPLSLERYMSSLSLPIYPDLSDDDVEYIARSVIAICDRRRKDTR